MNESQNMPKLSKNARDYLVDDIAFKNDKLERKKLAEKLTSYLSRLNDGAVLALDAPWGEGKTWFGKNWNCYLSKQGYKTVYIDAFEQDYIEDPFMLITSEILNKIEESDSKKFENLKNISVQVAKSLLPLGTKFLLNFGGRLLLGSSDISTDIKEFKEFIDIDNGTDIASEWVNKKLDNYIVDKTNISNFKSELEKYAQEQDKPIIIFIDELDRCKPTFAVNLIERIKHFFDIKNIIFILLLNRKQLENAVKGVYGQGTDANKYLDKFINFNFKFPKLGNSTHIKKQQLKSFIFLTMSKYDFEKNEDNDNFQSWMLMWSVCFDLSLRDIEKCIALYAFSYPTEYGNILAYFIALKTRKRDLFERLIKNDKEAHIEAKELIYNFLQRAKYEGLLNKDYLITFYEWHNAHSTDFKESGESFKNIIDKMAKWDIRKRDLFSHFGNMIDLDIER